VVYITTPAIPLFHDFFSDPYSSFEIFNFYYTSLYPFLYPFMDYAQCRDGSHVFNEFFNMYTS